MLRVIICIIAVFLGGICYSLPLVLDPTVNHGIQDQDPPMTFLGFFNNKLWYIQRINTAQPDARRSCETGGMNLARFDNHAELQFVYNRTTPEDSPAWSDGAVKEDISAYTWAGANPAPITGNVTVTFDARVGLAIVRNDAVASSSLVSEPVLNLHYFVCSASL